jgi:hypothetical protein
MMPKITLDILKRNLVKVMTDWLIIFIAIIILCFCFVVFFGPPYLPTLNPNARKAIEMINLKPGEILLELGSGDGKILKMFAETGVIAVGIELNPILVIVSKIKTWRHRKYVKIVWGNFWNTSSWPAADGIFVFILQKHMHKLDNKIMQWHGTKDKPVRLVSFAFKIPGKQPVKSSKSVYLYEYS